MFDRLAIDTCRGNIDMLVPWWLMASYAYYIEDDPIVSDATFDEMGKMLRWLWKRVRHRHKWIIDETNTGFYIKEYPAMVHGAVNQLRRTLHADGRSNSKSARKRRRNQRRRRTRQMAA